VVVVDMVGDSMEAEDSTAVGSVGALLLLELLYPGDIMVDFVGSISHLEVFQHPEDIMVGIMEDTMAVI